MLQEDNSSVDLTTILDENNINNKKYKNYFKCKIPIFFKDLFNLLIPLTIIVGIITLIYFIYF